MKFWRLLAISVLIGLPAASRSDGPGPVPVSRTRIVVAPFCGLPSDANKARERLLEVRQYCNAVYHGPWLFLHRKPSRDVVPNELDPWEINHVLNASAAAGLPCILTLHWGPTGQPDMMEWIAKKYAPSNVWQISADGKEARSPTDPFANLVCLMHPGVRAEIEETYRQAVAAARTNPNRNMILALGGTTEPMIARNGCGDCQPSGFCFNPAHVKWWQRYLARRWRTIRTFNQAFGTDYSRFEDIAPPKSLSPSALFAEYERGLRASLVDYETWQMRLMRRLEAKLPLLNHIASVLAIVAGGVRGSYTTFDAGSVDPGVPGGSVYTIPGHIADYAAIQMDGHRSFTRDDFAAIELGILGTWDGRGEEYKVWYSQMAARFAHVWSAPYAWTGGGSNLRETDAKDGLLWGTKLGTLTIGRPKLPSVALLTNYSAWTWDCDRARNAQLACYRALFWAGVDRTLVSDYQIEDGWLQKNRVKAVVVAEPFVVSGKVLRELRRAQKHGLLVVIVGGLPERDEIGRPLPLAEVSAFKTNKRTLLIDKPEVLPEALRRRLKLTNCRPGLEIVETDRGWCLVNVSHCRNSERLASPPRMTRVKLDCGNRTIEVPLQHFAFVERKTAKAAWIDEKGEWRESRP